MKRDWRKFFDDACDLYGAGIKACGFHEKSFFWRQQNILRFVGGIEQKRILDIGCGPGIFIQPWLKNNFTVGMDISEKMLKNAPASLKKVQAEIGKIPFLDESFDLVMAIEVIQCTESEPGSFLKEISRVLRKGGMLVITTINKQSLLRKIHSLVCSDYKPLSLFKMDGLKTVSQGEGFNKFNFILDFYPLRFTSAGPKHNFLSKILATSYIMIAKKD